MITAFPMTIYRPLFHVHTHTDIQYHSHPYTCVHLCTHSHVCSHTCIDIANFSAALNVFQLYNRNIVLNILNYIFDCLLNLVPLKHSTSKADHESCDFQEGVYGLKDVLTRTNKSKL